MIISISNNVPTSARLLNPAGPSYRTAAGGWDTVRANADTRSLVAHNNGDPIDSLYLGETDAWSWPYGPYIVELFDPTTGELFGTRGMKILQTGDVGDVPLNPLLDTANGSTFTAVPHMIMSYTRS